jgi:hypothetical protein
MSARVATSDVPEQRSYAMIFRLNPGISTAAKQTTVFYLSTRLFKQIDLSWKKYIKYLPNH